MTTAQLDIDRLYTMIRALAHPARIEILRVLTTEGDAKCVDLTRHVALAQPTVSLHLRMLKEAGLVSQCGDSPRAGYCVNREALLWFKQAIVAL